MINTFSQDLEAGKVYESYVLDKIQKIPISSYD